jgi:hypothetical protein
MTHGTAPNRPAMTVSPAMATNKVGHAQHRPLDGICCEVQFGICEDLICPAQTRRMAKLR